MYLELVEEGFGIEIIKNKEAFEIGDHESGGLYEFDIGDFSELIGDYFLAETILYNISVVWSGDPYGYSVVLGAYNELVFEHQFYSDNGLIVLASESIKDLGLNEIP